MTRLAIPSRRSTPFEESVLVAWLIGFAPFILLVMTWDPQGASSVWAYNFREHALPILAVEGLVVGIAAVSGLIPWLRQTPLFLRIAIAGWLIVAFSSAIFVAGSPRSTALTAIWLLHGGFAASVAFFCNRNDLLQRHLLRALQVGFVVYALAIAYFAFQVEGPIYWITDIPGLGNLRRVAAYATILAGLAIGLGARSIGWLPLATGVLAFSTAFWTGSRATLPAVVAAAIVAIAIFPKARNWRTIFNLVFSSLVGLAIALAVPFQAGVGNGALRPFTDTADNGRFRIWSLSLEAISQSPFIGHGEGRTAWVLPDNPLTKEDFQSHPHNFFLQLLMAWGVIGTAFVLVIAGWLATLLYRAGQNATTLPFVMGAGALTAHAMVDGALYDVAPVFLFAACVGAACATSKDIGTSTAGT